MGISVQKCRSTSVLDVTYSMSSTPQRLQLAACMSFCCTPYCVFQPHTETMQDRSTEYGSTEYRGTEIQMQLTTHVLPYFVYMYMYACTGLLYLYSIILVQRHGRYLLRTCVCVYVSVCVQYGIVGLHLTTPHP